MFGTPLCEGLQPAVPLNPQKEREDALKLLSPSSRPGMARHNSMDFLGEVQNPVPSKIIALSAKLQNTPRPPSSRQASSPAASFFAAFAADSNEPSTPSSSSRSTSSFAPSNASVSAPVSPKSKSRQLLQQGAPIAERKAKKNKAPKVVQAVMPTSLRTSTTENNETTVSDAPAPSALSLRPSTMMKRSNSTTNVNPLMRAAITTSAVSASASRNLIRSPSLPLPDMVITPCSPAYSADDMTGVEESRSTPPVESGPSRVIKPIKPRLLRSASSSSVSSSLYTIPGSPTPDRADVDPSSSSSSMPNSLFPSRIFGPPPATSSSSEFGPALALPSSKRRKASSPTKSSVPLLSTSPPSPFSTMMNLSLPSAPPSFSSSSPWAALAPANGLGSPFHENGPLPIALAKEGHDLSAQPAGLMASALA